MIIAFYGVAGGHTSTTSNLVSVALMSHFQYGYSVLLVGLGRGSTGVEQAFAEGEKDGRIAEEAEYFYHQGMDLVLQEAALGTLDEQVLWRAGSELIPGKVRVIPTAKNSCEERVFHLLSKYGQPFLDSLKQAADLVFLDCGKGEYPFMEEIRKQADVLVVNLAQSKRILNQFFLKRQTLSEKTVYLTGSYEELFPCNRTYILKHYRIAPENLLEISYHAGFREAVLRGRCLKFFKKNLPVPAYEKNRILIHQIESVSDCILRKGGYFA
jgi:hypothetical protein